MTYLRVIKSKLPGTRRVGPDNFVAAEAFTAVDDAIALGQMGFCAELRALHGASPLPQRRCHDCRLRGRRELDDLRLDPSSRSACQTRSRHSEVRTVVLVVERHRPFHRRRRDNDINPAIESLGWLPST